MVDQVISIVVASLVTAVLSYIYFRRTKAPEKQENDTTTRHQVDSGDAYGNMYVGCDVHNYHFKPSAMETDVQLLADTLKRELRRQAKQEIEKQCDEIVPLQVTNKIHQPRDFDSRRSSQWKYIPEFGKGSGISVENVFQEAKNAAQQRMRQAGLNSQARDAYVSKHGNVVGAIGRAGIGKTTFAKQMLESILNAGGSPFVFYIPLKRFDFNSQMSLFQFLVKTCLPCWNCPEMENDILNKIIHDKDVTIVFDCLDEAKIQELSDEVPTVSIHDLATPDVFLKNLLAGNLLPNAKKFICSRSGAFYELSKEYVPQFVVEVQGLDDGAIMSLTRRMCRFNDDFAKVTRYFRNNKAIKALCSIPMYCILVVNCLLISIKDAVDLKIFSVTQVLVFGVDHFVRSQYFTGDRKNLLKLARLAYDGLLIEKAFFTNDDLTAADINASDENDFLNIRIVDKANMKLKLFKKEGRAHFSHKIWLEMFSALHLLLNVPSNDFETKLRQRKLTAVIKYLYGLTNRDVFNTIDRLFEQKFDEQELEIKRQILYEHIIRATKSLHPKNQTEKLLDICTWVLEANSEHITQTVADNMPHMIKLSGLILPSDVAALCKVLARCKKEHCIKIGHGSKQCQISEEALTDLVKFVSGRQNISITTLLIEDMTIKGNLETVVLDHIVTLGKLSLSCTKVSRNFMQQLKETFTTRESKVRILNFNRVTIVDSTDGDHGICGFIAPFIHKVIRLKVEGCEIPVEGLRELSNCLKDTQQPLHSLNLSWNKINGNLSAILPCVFNISQLSLHGCHFTDTDDFLEKLAENLSRRTNKLELLSLQNNKFYGEAARKLGKCLEKIKRLDVSRTDLTAAQYGDLLGSLAGSQVILDSLSLEVKNYSSETIRVITSIVPNVKELGLQNCVLSPEAFQLIGEAIRKRSTPLTSLNLSWTHLEANGVEVLEECSSNVNSIDIRKCNLPSDKIWRLQRDPEWKKKFKGLR